MGSRLFRTLVGVGISLGGTATGCLGQSSDAGELAPRDPSDTGSGGTGGQGVEGSSAGTTLGEVPGTSTTTGHSSSATVGATSAGGTSGGSNTAGGSGGSAGTAAGGSGGSGGATAGGVGGSADGGSGAEPGAAGQGGDGPDPFCDTTWPTTKGNPPVPECVDPEHQCQNELPMRCLTPVGEFACDGHFEHSYAPFCKQGEWECEPGLVPVNECKCFAPIAEGFVCTEDGIVPLEGAAP